MHLYICTTTAHIHPVSRPTAVCVLPCQLEPVTVLVGEGLGASHGRVAVLILILVGVLKETKLLPIAAAVGMVFVTHLNVVVLIIIVTPGEEVIIVAAAISRGIVVAALLCKRCGL